MTLHYTQEGKQGPALILIHAFPLDHSMWNNQISVLAKEAKVTAIDLPGFGNSHTFSDDPSMAAYALSIFDLMDSLNIKEAVFAGCSIGGYIAFELWRQAKERVQGLVLVDTRPDSDSEEIRQTRMDIIDRVRSEGLDFFSDAMSSKLLGETTKRENPDLVKSVKETVLDCSPVGVIHGLQALAARPDSTDGLSTIDVPTLIIVGQEDTVTPPMVAQSMRDKISGSDYIEIPKAGHLSPMEQPEDVNKAIQMFIKKHY